MKKKENLKMPKLTLDESSKVCPFCGNMLTLEFAGPKSGKYVQRVRCPIHMEILDLYSYAKVGTCPEGLPGYRRLSADTDDVLVNTPWGWATGKSRKIISPDVYEVTTGSHSGYFVGPESSKRIPECFRGEGGWYEEDCMAGVVEFFLWDTLHDAAGWPVRVKDSALRDIFRWFPDETRQHTGLFTPYIESLRKCVWGPDGVCTRCGRDKESVDSVMAEVRLFLGISE